MSELNQNQVPQLDLTALNKQVEAMQQQIAAQTQAAQQVAGTPAASPGVTVTANQPQVNPLLLQMMQNAGINPAMTPGMWQQPRLQPKPFTITGISVPIYAQSSEGQVRVMFHLAPENGASPQALENTLENMIAAGIPVAAYQPKQRRGNRNRNRFNDFGGNSW